MSELPMPIPIPPSTTTSHCYGTPLGISTAHPLLFLRTPMAIPTHPYVRTRGHPHGCSDGAPCPYARDIRTPPMGAAPEAPARARGTQARERRHARVTPPILAGVARRSCTTHGDHGHCAGQERRWRARGVSPVGEAGGRSSTRQRPSEPLIRGSGRQRRERPAPARTTPGPAAG